MLLRHPRSAPLFPYTTLFRSWRQVGWNTMQHEVKLHEEIANFKAVDAEASDDKQISDIEELANGNCDALIVSPNTTDRKSTRLNSSHLVISYAVFCLKKKNN